MSNIGTEALPNPGELIAIEVRRNMRDFKVIRNFGPVVVHEDEDSRAFTIQLNCEAMRIADDILPISDVIAATVVGSTSTRTKICPDAADAIFLSSDKKTGVLDIEEIIEATSSYGTDRPYWEEIKHLMKDGLVYYYLVAHVVAVVEAR